MKCDAGFCAFEPRYDEHMPVDYTIPQNDDYLVDTDDYVKLIDALKTRVYVHDVCVKCGTLAVRK